MRGYAAEYDINDVVGGVKKMANAKTTMQKIAAKQREVSLLKEKLRKDRNQRLLLWGLVVEKHIEACGEDLNFLSEMMTAAEGYLSKRDFARLRNFVETDLGISIEDEEEEQPPAPARPVVEGNPFGAFD